MRANMTTLTQIWMTFLLSNILPSDHNSDFILPKCKLVYNIMEQINVHVVQLISDAIHHLSPSYVSFVFSLSSLTIPSKFQRVLRALAVQRLAEN